VIVDSGCALVNYHAIESRPRNLIVKWKHDFRPVRARIIFGLFSKLSI